MGNRETSAVRLILAIITVGNVILMSFGVNPIEVDEGLVVEAVSAVLAIVATGYAWWKNTPWSKEAQAAQGALNEAKNKQVSKDEAEAMVEVGVSVDKTKTSRQ